MYLNQTPPAALDTTLLQDGDSGSPVYALRGRRDDVFVWAYGVVSGSNGDTVVAPFDWIYVKLWYVYNKIFLVAIIFIYDIISFFVLL
jgi:hypothetical protein